MIRLLDLLKEQGSTTTGSAEIPEAQRWLGKENLQKKLVEFGGIPYPESSVENNRPPDAYSFGLIASIKNAMSGWTADLGTTTVDDDQDVSGMFKRDKTYFLDWVYENNAGEVLEYSSVGTYDLLPKDKNSIWCQDTKTTGGKVFNVTIGKRPEGYVVAGFYKR